MKTANMYGIEYSLPKVILLQETGIGTSEVAARSAYDSFDKSENEIVKIINNNIKNNMLIHDDMLAGLNGIEGSSLLDDLAWTYFHHSVLEHATLTYHISGISRGVLQEQSRHRIQSLTVRSTRYTMTPVINVFIASMHSKDALDWFTNKMLDLDIFVTTGINYNKKEIANIFTKLLDQRIALGYEGFLDIALSKSNRTSLAELDVMLQQNLPDKVFALLSGGKDKRNVGDAFKHIVNDNWKVDLVVSMNLRALKNYLGLRDSGAAYFQMRWLAEAINKATPNKYLKLITKKIKEDV